MRQIKQLLASTFSRPLTSGRTRPAILACEDSNGESAGEFVIKFRGGIDTGVAGLACELLASVLADELGLSTPAPAVVEIDQNTAALIQKIAPALGTIVGNSVGLNFASEVLQSGFSSWPVGKYIPLGLRQAALEVFAFDALIQNPDRKYSNPNLLSNGKELCLIDHELAFSFLYEIASSSDPWELSHRDFDFLKEHVFYRQLKGQKLELERFVGALNGLSDKSLVKMTDQLPSDWKTSAVTRILDHLKTVRNHSKKFTEQLKWRLS
jgi:hypothetical protein